MVVIRESNNIISDFNNVSIPFHHNVIPFHHIYFITTLILTVERKNIRICCFPGRRGHFGAGSRGGSS